MNRADALKVLRLSDDSDGHAIEQSYWSLVRRAQAGKAAASQREIDRLNEAYALLAPTPETMARTAVRQATFGRQPRERQRPAPAVFPGDTILDWFGAEAGRVRARWAGRNLEIAMVCGAGLVLVVLAFMAGAAAVPVLMCLAVIVAGLWCPWRSSAATTADGDARERD